MPVSSHALGGVFSEVAVLDGVPEAVERARAAVDRLRAHRVLRRRAETVAAESALHGARASAALAGADLPLDVVRRTVAAGGRFPANSDAVLQGAMRVAAESGRLQATWRSAPLQALARLHAVAASELVSDPERLGRPTPAAAPRLGALAAALTSGENAPALAVAAVVHGEIAASGAFPAAGGVVARAAFRLTLVTRGLDPSGISVPEVGFLELGREAYAAGLRAYAEGNAAGISAWVVHAAEAVALGAREATAICESLQR